MSFIFALKSRHAVSCNTLNRSRVSWNIALTLGSVQSLSKNTSKRIAVHLSIVSILALSSSSVICFHPFFALVTSGAGLITYPCGKTRSCKMFLSASTPGLPFLSLCPNRSCKRMRLTHFLFLHINIFLLSFYFLSGLGLSLLTL